MIQQFAQPAATMKMASGKIVPQSRPFSFAPIKEKKFLMVIQFYEGDREAAEDLAMLIADLEPTKNRDVDVMLFRRADSKLFSATAKAKLETKFDKVMEVVCRRVGARGHPYGCNEMFYDLVSLLSNSAPYRDDYYAFINLESDATPTRSGWLNELIVEWKLAHDEGKAAIGHIHDNPVRHMNGLAVYASDIWRRVGSRILNGGSPQVCYDIRHAKSILPLAKHSPLIFFHFRHSTVTPEELFAPQNGVVPALFHGVKDTSARHAVRARHISHTDAVQTKRPNVYTYYHQVAGQRLNDAEVQAVLDLWRQGWTAKGWNPIILTFRDAQKHPRYAEFETAVSRLPSASTDRARHGHQFYRWLALDVAGGGLLTDYDALPDELTPAGVTDAHAQCFSDGATNKLCALAIGKDASASWIGTIMEYNPKPTDAIGAAPHVTDGMIIGDFIGKIEVQLNAIAHFNTDLIGTERKSVAMARFLRR